MLHILIPFCILFVLWTVITSSKVAGFFLALLTLPVLAFLAALFMV